jgi:chromosome segregation ATPase
MVLCRTGRSRAIAISLLAVLGAVLEGLQYFIPTRFCEWQDVALSWVGLLLTWGLAESLYWSAGRLRRFRTPHRHGRKDRSNARQSPLTEQEAQYQAELTRMQGEQEQMQAYLAQLQAEITRLHEVEFTLKTELAQTQQFSADADHFRHDKEISASQQALAQKQKELAAAQGQLEADQQKFAADTERFEEFAKQEAEWAHLAQEIAQRDRQLAENQKTLNDLLERHAAEQEKVEVERLVFLQEKSKLDKERATVQNASAVLEADKTALEAEMAKHTDAVKRFESKRAQFQEEMKSLSSAD